MAHKCPSNWQSFGICKNHRVRTVIVTTSVWLITNLHIFDDFRALSEELGSNGAFVPILAVPSATAGQQTHGWHCACAASPCALHRVLARDCHIWHMRQEPQMRGRGFGRMTTVYTQYPCLLRYEYVKSVCGCFPKTCLLKG